MNLLESPERGTDIFCQSETFLWSDIKFWFLSVPGLLQAAGSGSEQQGAAAHRIAPLRSLQRLRHKPRPSIRLPLLRIKHTYSSETGRGQSR